MALEGKFLTVCSTLLAMETHSFERRCLESDTWMTVLTYSGLKQWPHSEEEGERLGLQYTSAFCYFVISDVLAEVFSYYHHLGSDWRFSCGILLLLGLAKVLARANTKW